MERRIAYRDRHLGELLVPRVTATFRTDLTSVPAAVHLAGAEDRTAPAGDAAARRPDPPAGRRHLRLDRGARRPARSGRPGAARRDGRRRHRPDPALVDLVGGGDGDDAQWCRHRVVASDGRYHRARRWSLDRPGDRRPGVGATLDLFDAAVPARSCPGWGTAPGRASTRGWLGDLRSAWSLVLSLLWGAVPVAGAVVGVTLAVLLHVTVALLGPTARPGAEWLTARAPVHRPGPAGGRHRRRAAARPVMGLH